MKHLTLLICLLSLLVSAQAQHKSAYTTHLKMTNGIDTVTLLPHDQLPYSFFKTGYVRSYEDSLCKRYFLNIIFYKKGKGSFATTNHYQWSDTIVQTLIRVKPDSLMFLKNIHANEKAYPSQFFIKLVY
jgi:hypothetical protein